MTPIILEMVNTPAFCLSIQPILSLCTSNRYIAVIAVRRWQRCFPIQFQSMKAILHLMLSTVLILLVATWNHLAKTQARRQKRDAVLMPLYTYKVCIPGMAKCDIEGTLLIFLVWMWKCSINTKGRDMWISAVFEMNNFRLRTHLSLCYIIPVPSGLRKLHLRRKTIVRELK